MPRTILEPITRRRALLGFLALTASAQRIERLPRENRLLFRDQTGSVKPVRSVREWNRRREEIVSGMQLIMGALPGDAKRCPLNMRVEQETEAPAYVQRLITYSSEPGSRVPAFLLIPKAVLSRGEKAWGALCLHPTDNQIGHRVVVDATARANRQYAAEMASRGYVVLAPAYPLLANYQPDWRALGYQSGSMKAIWDNIRGLDLLESLPYVRKGWFAAIGHSLGGHNSVYTAVFEPRIRVVVSSCGLDSYLDYKGGDIRGWTSDRYMPKLLDYKDRLQEIPFDFHEMIGALAPRACFISAPLGDDNFRWKSVDQVVDAARQVYRLYGREGKLVVEHPDCAHDFPDAVREKAYSFIDSNRIL